MTTTPFVRATLLAVAFCFPAFAQQIAPGTYNVTQMDGSPVRPGVQVRTVLIPPFFGDMWVGLVYVDTGAGFTMVETENFFMVVRGGVGYWLNNSGNEGHIDPRADGTLKSTVDTGPNAGTERLMTR